MHDALDLRDLLADELAQRRESGHLVGALEGPVARALDAATGPADPELEAMLEALAASERDPTWSYEEPDDLEAIVATLPDDASTPGSSAPDRDDLADRILGAWLGRCAGCTLGKPVEGLPRTRLLEFLGATGADPREGYLPGSAALADAFGLKETWPISTRGGIAGVPRDDDVDYTILALHILERWGPDFTSERVTETLLLSLPYLRVFTAERVTYRNLTSGLHPPATATYRNPYREWIGALIRADMYGFVSPGGARRAACLAFKDATTSHTANGVFAAMWAAALVAEALVRHDAVAAVTASLGHVPPQSRLAECLERTIGLHSSGVGWEEARGQLAQWYGDYSWVHAIPNAAAIAAALLWGDGDFGQTVGLAVLSGLDTDSAAATAGSVIGALHGRQGLPTAWIDPFEDHIHSAVMGFDGSRISELASRTLALAALPG